MEYRGYTRLRRNGRFFGRRVNCERVPLLPAWAVRWVLDDPRKIPYLLVWVNDSGGAADAVRVASFSDPDTVRQRDYSGWVEVRRPDGTRTLVRTVLRPLQRNGGRDRLLVCTSCGKPCRALYGWRPGGQFTNSVEHGDWYCRVCAELRYRSEGTYRPRMFRFLGGYPRPDLWYPYVFTSTEQAAALGLCKSPGGHSL